MKEKQRGWKGQPVGRLNGWGIDPLMVASFNLGTASMLGMNVVGIQLAQIPEGFLTIVYIVVTFTAIAGWWAFRKKQD